MEKQRISQEHCTVGKSEHFKDAQRTRSCMPEQFGKKNIYEASSNVSWKNIVKKVRRTNQYVAQKETLGEPAPFFGIQASVSPFGFLSKEKLVAKEILSKPDSDNQKKIERDDVGSEKIERIGSYGTNTYAEKFSEGVCTILEQNNNGGLEKISNAGHISNKKIQEDVSTSDRIKEEDGNSNSSLRSAEGEEETSQEGEAPKEEEEEEETAREEGLPLEVNIDPVGGAFSDLKALVEGVTPEQETDFEGKPDLEEEASCVEGYTSLEKEMLVEGVDKDCNLKEKICFAVGRPIEATLLEGNTPLTAKPDLEREEVLKGYSPYGIEELVERGTPSGKESKCEREITTGEGERLLGEVTPVAKERPLKGNTKLEEESSFVRHTQSGPEITAEGVLVTEEEETSPLGRCDPVGGESLEGNVTVEGENEESRHLQGKTDHEGQTTLEEHTPHGRANFVGEVTPVVKEYYLGGETAYEGEAEIGEKSPVVEERPLEVETDPKAEIAAQGVTECEPEITAEGETPIEERYADDKEPHTEGTISFVAEKSFEGEGHCEGEGEGYLQGGTAVERKTFLEGHTAHGRENFVGQVTSVSKECHLGAKTASEGVSQIEEETPLVDERPLGAKTDPEAEIGAQGYTECGAEISAEGDTPIEERYPDDKEPHTEGKTTFVAERSFEVESHCEGENFLQGGTSVGRETSHDRLTPYGRENSIGEVTSVAKECHHGEKTAFEGETQIGAETPLVEERPLEGKADPDAEIAAQGCAERGPDITVEGETPVEKIHPGGKEPHSDGKIYFVAERPFEGEGHCEGEGYFQGDTSVERKTAVEEETPVKEGEQVEGQTSLDRETEQGLKFTQDQAPHSTPEVCELSQNSGQQEGSYMEEVHGSIGQISGDCNDIEPSSCTTESFAITEQPNSQVTSQIVTVIVENNITELTNVRKNHLSRDSQISEDTSQKSEQSVENLCEEGNSNTLVNKSESSEGTTDKVLEEAVTNVPGMITFTTGEELVSKLASLTSEGNVPPVETGECLEDTQQSTERRELDLQADGDLRMPCSGIRDDVQDVMVTEGQGSSPHTTFTDLTKLSPIRSIPAVANTNSTHALISSSSCDNSINISGSGNISQNIASSPEKQLSELMRVVDELFAIHQDGVAVECGDVGTLLESGDGTNDSKNLPLLFKTPPRRPNTSVKLGEDTTYGESMHLGEESCSYPRNSAAKNVSQLDTLPSVSHSYQTVSLRTENSFGDSDCNFQVNFSSSNDSPGPSNMLENTVSHEVTNQIYDNDSSEMKDSTSTFNVSEKQLKGKEDTLTKKLADIVESSKSRTKEKHKLEEKRETTSRGKVVNVLNSSDCIQEERRDKINLQEKEDCVPDGQGSLGLSSPTETAALPETSVHEYGMNNSFESRHTPLTDIPVPGFRIVPQYDIPEPVNEPFPTSVEVVVPAIAMEVEILNGRQEEEEVGVFVPPGSIEDLSGDETSKKPKHVKKSKKTHAKICANNQNAAVDERPKRKRGRSKRVAENLEKVDTGITKKCAKKVPKRRKFVSEEEEIKNAAEVLTSLFSSDESDRVWRPSRPGISEQRIDNTHAGIKNVGLSDENKQRKVISGSTLPGTLGSKSNAKLKQRKNGKQGTAVVNKNSITPDMEALLSKLESEFSADQTGQEKVMSKSGCRVCKRSSKSCVCKKRTKVQRKKLQFPRSTARHRVESNDGPQSGHSCSYQLTFDDEDGDNIEENSARADNLSVRNEEEFKNRNDKEAHLSETSVQKNLFWLGEKSAEIINCQPLQLSVKESVQVKSSVTAELSMRKDFESQRNILSQPTSSDVLEKNTDSVHLSDFGSSQQLGVENMQELSEAKSEVEEKKNEETKQLPSVQVSENITQKDKESTEESECVSQQPVIEKFTEKSCQKEDLRQKCELEGANSHSVEEKDPVPRAIVFEVIKDNTQSDCDIEDLPITFLQATSDGASELDPQEQLNRKCSVVSEPLRISMNSELVDEKVATIVGNINRCSEDNGDQLQPGGETQPEECKDSEEKDQKEEEVSMSLPTDQEICTSQKEKRKKNFKTGFSPSLMKKYEQIRQISEKSRARRMKKYQQRQKSCRGASVRKQWEVEIVDEASEMVLSATKDDSVDLQRTAKEVKSTYRTEPLVEETLSPSTLSKYSELIKNRMSPKVVLTDYRRLSGLSSPESDSSSQKSPINMKNEISKKSDKTSQVKEKYKNILSSIRSPSKKQESSTPSQLSYFFGKGINNDSKICFEKENNTPSFSLMEKTNSPQVISSDDVCVVSGDELVTSDEDSYKLTTLDADKERELSVKQSGEEKDLKGKQDVSCHGNQNDQENKKEVDTSSVVNVSTEEKGSNYTKNDITDIALVEEMVGRQENLHQEKCDGNVLSVSSNKAKSTSHVEESLEDKGTVNSDKEIVETTKGNSLKGGDNSSSSVSENLSDCVPVKTKKMKMVLKDILPRRKGREKRGGRKTKTVQEVFISKDAGGNLSSSNEGKSSVHQRKGKDEVGSDNGRKGMENEAENVGQSGENNLLLGDLQEVELGSPENVESTSKIPPHNGHVTDVCEMEDSRLPLDGENLENKSLEEQKVVHDEGSSVNCMDDRGDSVKSCIGLPKEHPLQDELCSQAKLVFDEESSHTEVVSDEGKTDGAENDLPVENVSVLNEKQRSPEKGICSRTRSTIAKEHVNKDANLMSMKKDRSFHNKESRGGDGTSERENTSESGLEKQGNHSPDKNNLNAETRSVGLSEEVSTDLEEKNDDGLGDGKEFEKEYGVEKLEMANNDTKAEFEGDLNLKMACGKQSVCTVSENAMDFAENLPLSAKLRPCFVVLKPLDLVECEKGVSCRSELRKYLKREMPGGLKDEGRKKRKLDGGVDESPKDSVQTEVQQVPEIHDDSISSDVYDLKHREEEKRKRKEKKGKKRKKQREGEEEEEEKGKKTDIGLGKEVFDRNDGGEEDSLLSAMEEGLSSCGNKELEITPTAEKEEVEGIQEQDASDKEDENSANDTEEWMDTASGNIETDNNQKDRETCQSDGNVTSNGEVEAGDGGKEENEGESEKHGEGDDFFDDDCLSITAECTDLLSEFEDEEMETEPTTECEPAKEPAEPPVEQTQARLEYENISSDDNLGLSPDGSRVQKQGPSLVKGPKSGTSGNVPPQDLLPVKLMPRIPKKSTAIIAAVTSRNASQSNRNPSDGLMAGDDVDGPHPPSVTRKLHPDIPTVSFAGENHPGLPVPSPNGESMKDHGKILSTSSANAATSKQAADAGWQLTDKARQKCPPGYCYKFAEFGKCHYGATCRFKHVLLQDIPRPELTHGNTSQPSQPSLPPPLLQSVQQPPPLMQNIITKPPTITESSKLKILNLSPFPEEGPLLPDPPTLGDRPEIAVSSADSLLESASNFSSLPPLFPHEMEEFLTYIETCSKDGELLQNKTSDAPEVEEKRDNVSSRRDDLISQGSDLTSRRNSLGGTAARSGDSSHPATSRSNSLSVVHNLLRKKRISDAWNVYRLKTQQEGYAPDRQLLTQIIKAFPSAKFSKLKWKDCKEALKELGRTFAEDITLYCLEIIQHLCDAQENDPEDDEDYEDPLPIAVSVFKDCMPCQNIIGPENVTLNILSEKLIQESHWSLLATFVSLQLNRRFRPSFTSVSDVILKYHVLNNHYDDLVNLMKKIDESNVKLPSSLYDSVKNCLAASSQYTDEGLTILKMKGKFYPLDSIETSLVEMCSVDQHEIELIEAPAPGSDRTSQIPENVSSGERFVDGEMREIATIIQKARDVDTLVQLFLTIAGSGEAHLLDARVQDCFAFTIGKMAPSNHCHFFRKFVQCVVNDPRTGDAEKKFVVGIGKILFETSWKNKHAANAYQLLETMSEYDENSIQTLFLAKEKPNNWSVVYGELHAVINCYINACDILQACRVLNSLAVEDWGVNFWKKISNSVKWRVTILDLGKRLASAGYLRECLQLLRNYAQGMTAPSKSMKTRQITKEVFNLLLSNSFERDENVFALEQVFPAIQELSVLDKNNTILMVRVFASQGTPETTRMAKELFQKGLKHGIYLRPVINESIHEGKVQVCSDSHEISIIVQEFFRQSDKFLTGVYTDLKCDEDRVGAFINRMKFRFLVTVVGSPVERNTSSADAVVDETLMKIIQELAKVISQFNCQIETLNDKEKAVNLPPDAFRERFLSNMQRQMFH